MCTDGNDERDLIGKARIRGGEQRDSASEAHSHEADPLDGKPAAFAYNYHYRGHVYGLRMGFANGHLRQRADAAVVRWQWL